MLLTIKLAVVMLVFPSALEISIPAPVKRSIMKIIRKIQPMREVLPWRRSRMTVATKAGT